MSKLIRKVLAPVLAAVLVLMLCCAGVLMPQGSPNKAYAVVNLGALSMSMAPQAQVSAGGTVNVSCVVSPGSSSQIPNCASDYCPSGCDAHPIAGMGNGCQDASGQCTCNGGGYTTYYPQVAVYSDNPGVARGTWSGNTLTISGYAPGTAHISATGSMRLFTPASQSITVTVAESGSGASGGGGGSGSGSGGTGGTYVAPRPSAPTSEAVPTPATPVTPVTPTVPSSETDTTPSESAHETSTTPSISATPSTSTKEIVNTSSVVAVGDSTASSEQVAAATQVVQLVTEAAGTTSADEVAAEGGQTIVAALGDAAISVRELLSQIVDTANQVMFWAGSNEEVPDYVWSAQGSKITSAPERDIDLTVRDVTLSESKLADALSGRTYMALDTSACGRLPGEMTLTYRVADVFATGSYVNVYAYDAAAGTLARVQRNVAVTDGYVSVPVSEGALLVISGDEDLASVTVDAATDAAAADADADANAANAGGDGAGGDGAGSNGAVPAGAIAAVVAVVVVAAGAAGGVMYARRRKGVAAAGVDAAASRAEADAADAADAAAGADAAADAVAGADAAASRAEAGAADAADAAVADTTDATAQDGLQ